MANIKLHYQLDMSDESVWLTATPNPDIRASFAYVQELGDFISGPKYYTRRENLPSYLIKLCLSGEGLLDYGGNTYTVRPGQLFWIDCMQPQYYRTSPAKGNWRVLWVHFYGGSSVHYYELFSALNDGCPMVNVDADVGVRSTLDALITLYRDGRNNLQDDVQASELITRLMVRCIAAAGKPRESSRMPRYVQDVRDYINDHYAERITLDDLSKLLSVNKYYLQKLFKRHMGVSPNEYLIQTRLTHAKELLRTTGDPVSHISMDVGISNIGHFIGLFKKHEGIPPSVYRKRWYQNGAEDAHVPDGNIL